MARITILIVALCALAAPARAAVWYVTGNHAGDGTAWARGFQTIQQGVDAARPGDEVWVSATARYAETVTMSRPNVALYGGFRGTERHREERLFTLRSGALPSGPGPAFRILSAATGATVDGFSIAGSVGAPGIQIEADGVTLSRSEIRDNNAPGWQGGGVRCTGDAVLIVDNLITGNVASAAGGLFVWSDNARILRNRIENNTADNLGRVYGVSGSGGGMMLQGTGIQVRNNVIAWNMAVRYFSAPMAGAVAEGGGVLATGEVAFVNNTLAHNTALGTEGARGGGFAFDIGTFVLANNMSSRNSVRAASEGATATGGGIYFPRGEHARTTVTFRANSFCDDAPDPGVPDGTDTLFGYSPQFVSESDFHLTKWSPLIDIGANEYLLSEDRDADGGPRVIGTAVDIGAYEFGTPTTEPTLARGYVRPDGDDRNDGASWKTARRSVGSAISVAKPGSEIWVAEGIYKERVTLKSGIALYGGFVGFETSAADRNPRARPTILDGDHRGSVVTIPEAAIGARVDGFTIRHGSGTMVPVSDTSGGGVYSAAANVVLSNNIIEDNHVFGSGKLNWLVGRGGGASLGGDGLIVIGNIIRNNTVETYGQGFGYAAYASAIGGGLFVSSEFAVIANNLLTGNSVLSMGMSMQNGAAGGGLYPVMTGGIIAGNTIADNTAVPGLGGTFREEQPDYASPRISNNIIAFNAGSILTGYGLPYYDNNLVHGNERSYPATAVGRDGNIAADPLFANAAGGDYRLQPGSPAIDAGNNTAAFSAVDMDGNPRFQGRAVDIGAYEWTPGGPVTVGDAAAALRIAAGLSAATPDLMPRLNVERPATSGIDLLDAVRLLRETLR